MAQNKTLYAVWLTPCFLGVFFEDNKNDEHIVSRNLGKKALAEAEKGHLIHSLHNEGIKDSA